MTFYPTIAELNYKNKNISVKIPIRVKKIQLVKYLCGICVCEGTGTEIIKYITKRSDKFEDDKKTLKMVYDKVYRCLVPSKFVVDRKTIYCPKCYEKNKEMNLTKITTNFLYKAYTTASPEYIDTEKLVLDFFPLRWKAFTHNRRTKLEVFFKDFQEMVVSIEACLKQKPKTKRGVTVKTKYKKIDSKLLDTEFHEYEKRKVVRAI